MRTLAVCLVVCAASAQAPIVGEIDFYGLHRVTPERVLAALHLKSGDPMPPSRGDLEEALEKISGVVAGRVEAVCCEGPRASLIIGIEEKGAPVMALHTAPEGQVSLPEELEVSYRQFVTAVQRAATKGETAEDLSAGHPIMADAQARAFQTQFQEFAANHLDQLRDVLKNAAEPDQRAMAATVIDYAPRKQAVVDDLQYAIADPDESVRVNAARSLTAIAVLSAKQPALGIKVAPTWFLEMLNSLVLSDRVESARALLTLSDGGDPAVLELIRERGLGPLAEMARWKTVRYALPSFLLLGRVAGLPDAETHLSWEKGDREAVIEKATASARKH